jgi:hypothetical protein
MSGVSMALLALGAAVLALVGTTLGMLRRLDQLRADADSLARYVAELRQETGLAKNLAPGVGSTAESKSHLF